MSIRDILSQSEELDRDIPEEEPEQPEQAKETQQNEEPQDEGTDEENSPVEPTPDPDDGEPDSLPISQADPDGERPQEKAELPSQESDEDGEVPDISSDEKEGEDLPQQDSPPDLPDGELPEISVNDIRAPQMTDMQIDTGAPELPESESIPQDGGVSNSMDASSNYPASSDVPSDSQDQPQSQPGKEEQYQEFSTKLLDNRQQQADDIAKSLSEEFRPMFEQSIERNKQAARDYMNMMISQQQLLGDE